MTNFNLNSVNGVTFQANSVFFASGSSSYNSSTHETTVPSGSTTHLSGQAVTIDVLNASYTPPTANALATFGEIKIVSDFNSQLYYYATVLGYTSNALLLSPFGQNLPADVTYASHVGDDNVLSDSPKSSTTFPLVFADNETYVPPCFAEGARLLTVRGAVAVEDLVEGDIAITASGAARPVVWIGHRRVRPDAYPNASEVQPIRIRTGAFAPSVPSRDLRLSPGHAVYVDGVLIPAGKLVNGATILQEAVESVRYFHIELDSHDVLLAEGLPCESYLDDGNRAVFANGDDPVALHGRLDALGWSAAFAPRVIEGDALTAVQAQLHARAVELGWEARPSADLWLLTRVGLAIQPLHAAEDRVWFVAPAGQLTLASCSGRPCELVPGAADARRLGVALAELRIDGQTLDLDDPRLGDGFFAQEREGGVAWRWTNGAATLSLCAQALLELRLHMVALSWSRPAAKALRLARMN